MLSVPLEERFKYDIKIICKKIMCTSSKNIGQYFPKGEKMKQSRAPLSLLLMFPKAHASGQLGSRLQVGPVTRLEEQACPNPLAFGPIFAVWTQGCSGKHWLAWQAQQNREFCAKYV